MSTKVFISWSGSLSQKLGEALRNWLPSALQFVKPYFSPEDIEKGITCSMSRAGEVWDNSAMESFFSTLKIERVHRKVYRTRAQARADVFDFIEVFYNPKRRHSTIRYLSPVKFEEALFA